MRISVSYHWHKSPSSVNIYPHIKKPSLWLRTNATKSLWNPQFNASSTPQFPRRTTNAVQIWTRETKNTFQVHSAATASVRKAAGFVCVCVCAGALTWHVSALWPKRGMLVRFQVTVNWRQWETTGNNGWYTYRCAGHWKEKEKKDPAWFCNRASGKKFDCGLETRRFLDLFPQPHLVLGTDSLMPGSWVVLTAAPVWQNYTIRVITVTKR